MHRVELKAGLVDFQGLSHVFVVPNAPCGVERNYILY